MMQDNVPQARIYKVWNIPGYKQRDFTLLDMTSDLLGGGKNSRLYKRLVYTDRTATDVTAGVGPFEIGSQVQIIATVKPGVDPAVVEKALDEELARFLATGPTADGARAHPHDELRVLRARHRAHRRLRRQVVDPRREPGVRRLAGFLQDAPRLGQRARRPPMCRARRSAGCRMACSCSTWSRCRRTRPWPAPWIAARCPRPARRRR